MRYLFGLISLFWKLYIGIIFVVTAIIYYPLITPLLFKENHKEYAFKVFVLWSWTVRILCFYHVRRINKQTLPKEPFVLVANHISYFDIFFMYSTFPNQHFLFLGKSEILRYPLIKTYFKRLNIPVYRGNRQKSGQALVRAKKAIDAGWSIVIFPEGGIPNNDAPRMVRFKDGAFQLAKSMNVPIVPITFLNNHLLFSDPANLLGPARPGISKVYMHPPITKEEIQNLEVVELRKKCFELIQKPLIDLYPRLGE